MKSVATSEDRSRGQCVGRVPGIGGSGGGDVAERFVTEQTRDLERDKRLGSKTLQLLNIREGIELEQVIGGLQDVPLVGIRVEHTGDDGLEIAELIAAMIADDLVQNGSQGHVAHHILQHATDVTQQRQLDPIGQRGGRLGL